MTKIKRVAGPAMAVFLAAAMPMTAFAASEPVPAEANGAMTVDSEVSVKGLQAGDTVKFYQVLKWSDGWVATDAFKGAFSEDELKQLVEGSAGKAGGISFELAGKLGAASTDAEVMFEATESNGEAVFEGPEAGLYMGIIVPGAPGYTYNPVFVAADFSSTNNSGVWDFSESSLGYTPDAKAKVNTLDITKSAASDDENGPGTADIGEIITYTVETTIPLYASNYVAPVFRLTDKLSEGLMLQSGTVKITAGEAELAQGQDYKLAENEDGSGYVADFTQEYLKAMTDPVQIKVTYDAEVVTADTTSVSPEDNTVTLNFSHTPDDTTGAGVLRDRTNHYTFDIDGSLFGSEEYGATEVVKIGVDANGNEITEQKQLDNGKWVGALAGAKFKLCTDEAGENVYKNDSFDGNEVVSDENGRMHMKGLDAGTYYLIETEAPAGYIKYDQAVKIEIVPAFEEVDVTETVEVTLADGATEEREVTYKLDVLKSYEIKINGAVTANYEITNEKAEMTQVNKGDNVGNETEGENNPDGIGKIVNKLGVELPSTGGMGTTIFYVLGAALVVGSGVVLVTKKRVSDKKEEA